MGRNAIEAKKLIKRFGTRNAVDGIDFCVPENAFVSIFGPNGAGKTTLLRLFSTMTRPTEGHLSVLGLDAKEDAEEIRGRIGVISHESMLYPNLTAQENLRFYAELYGVQNPQKRALELLDAVGLKHRRFEPVKNFSRGMVQRLAIARALINDPEILFLDEPYSGLDPHAVLVFDELLQQVREDRTFIMVSHDMEKGLELCTHALVLNRGKIVTYEQRQNLDYAEFKQLYLDTVGTGVS